MTAPTSRPTAAHARASWQRVTAALEQAVGGGREAGSWTRYCCPVHEGDGRAHDPSLGVKYLTDAGRTKVRCFAGCPDTEILGRLDLQVSDLYDEPITRAGKGFRRPTRAPQPRPVPRAEQAITAAGLPLVKVTKDHGAQTGGVKTVASYPYVDQAGVVVGEVVRRHIPHEHGRKKEFYQRHWNPQTGRMEAGGFAPVPFQLPQLLDAIGEGRSVYVCEGEEDVLAAARAGIPATCNAAGAGKWRPEHAQWLKGARRVVIVADRDAPGYRHADKVAESLRGLVGEVRIVQAAAGKDLRDHFAAGHELGELEPVPGLDPRTPLPARAEAVATPFAGDPSPARAADGSQLDHPTTNGGSHMPDNSTINLSGLHSSDSGHHHDDTMDHIGGRFAMLMQRVMQEVMQRAITSHAARREAAEQWRKYDERRRAAEEAQHAAQRKAVEKILAAAKKTGFDRLSRSEIAAVLKDAVEWAPDSDAARHAATELADHIRERWGVHVDVDNGHVTVDAPPEMAAKLAAAEQERAAAARLATAQDRMVEMIATEGVDEESLRALRAQIEQWRTSPSPEGVAQLAGNLHDFAARGADGAAKKRLLEQIEHWRQQPSPDRLQLVSRQVQALADASIDESTRQSLYAAVEQWRKAPSPQGLQQLTEKMKAAGVGEKTRTRTRFVALYLGAPAVAETTPITDLGGPATLASTALRKLDEPLVDPGEEVKYRVDTLLMDYQAKLKHGHDTVSVQARLADAVSVMTPEDQQIARDRGKAIRDNPAGQYRQLWPEHVDRDELAATVRAYAALAPTVEATAASADGTDVDANWAAAQRDRATTMRSQIDKAIRSGKGLDRLEKDQLRAVLADVEAGKTTVPDMLLADDRTTAALDRDRADEIGYRTAAINRREVEEILSGHAAPETAVRSVRDELGRVAVEQARLAAGRTSLRDYEGTGADEKLLAGLVAGGVPEPVRNQVRKALDNAREDSAVTGHQARRIQDRWADRREAVAVQRTPEGPAYDSPERRAGLAHNLRNAGLSPDEVRQNIAADGGRAKPPSTPVQAPAPEKKVRLTTPGTGLQQAYNRANGRDQGIGD
ncbi:5S rRNA maturation endonuclease (ribonuclease M5) [Nocardia transvalensis]|uniref:5S rRNA maturation endonuclease (Ribonuclease M5) n=1 Tax=Nocardia transvalensis TaxID=37333 RepID=A0A7W9UNL3_9NOCA|nr:toprim domain-containing protein [Nocardia transvalensis]MBB5918960.1 5S rRNA maturation endonuclease (ribonuclease M5) [Nocardia transvalensis]